MEPSAATSPHPATSSATRAREPRRRGRSIVVALVLVGATAPAALLDAGPRAAADEAALTVVSDGATASGMADRMRPTYTMVFPVDPTPRCSVLDNFGDPRSGGRRHAGVDILTNQGQAVFAAMDGLLTRKVIAGNPDARLSGNAWGITGVDGDYYFYGHLSAFAPGLQLGGVVRAGDVIGYVGDTGNPGPGNFHLHFEIRRGGARGVPFDPLPILPVPGSCRIW